MSQKIVCSKFSPQYVNFTLRGENLKGVKVKRLEARLKNKRGSHKL